MCPPTKCPTMKKSPLPVLVLPDDVSVSEMLVRDALNLDSPSSLALHTLLRVSKEWSSHVMHQVSMAEIM